MQRTLLLSAGALLLLPAGGRAGAVRLPNGDDIREVDFERHVVALLGRAGCNAGSCHGSFQGRGGFRLSLLGFDPQADFDSLTREAPGRPVFPPPPREAGGRRVFPALPERSLVLLKPTGAIAHGGGKRLTPDTPAYRVLR